MSRTNKDHNGDEIVTIKEQEGSFPDAIYNADYVPLGETICKRWRVGIGRNGHVYLQVGTRERVKLFDHELVGPPTSSTIRRACELAYILGKNDGVGECVAHANTIIQDLEQDLDDIDGLGQ